MAFLIWFISGLVVGVALTYFIAIKDNRQKNAGFQDSTADFKRYLDSLKR